MGIFLGGNVLLSLIFFSRFFLLSDPSKCLGAFVVPPACVAFAPFCLFCGLLGVVGSSACVAVAFAARLAFWFV